MGGQTSLDADRIIYGKGTTAAISVRRISAIRRAIEDADMADAIAEAAAADQTTGRNDTTLTIAGILASKRSADTCNFKGSIADNGLNQAVIDFCNFFAEETAAITLLADGFTITGQADTGIIYRRKTANSNCYRNFGIA